MDKIQNNNGPPDRMTVKMASDVRGVSQRTIRRWISTGRLKAVKTDGQWMIEASQPNGRPPKTSRSNAYSLLSISPNNFKH